MTFDATDQGSSPHGDGVPVDAVPLDGLLADLELAQVLRIAIGVCKALSSLHASSLLHHDIKPSNVLVSLSSGRVWLVGARSNSQATEPRALRKNSISTSLAYLAPERTGRTTSLVDRRADLYSLGVTLYQLATGKLPFAASEPSEWVHAHVAVRPIPPSDLERAPEMLQRILFKLLEKEPDDRYQTAAGLAHDLGQCLTRLEKTGHIPLFPLGRRDMPGQLSRRSTFLGRGAELNALAAAADRVQRSGAPEVVIVSGYSGIGKSALVREALGRRLAAGTLVAVAKFDERQGDAPYATLMQLFRELCRWVLSRPARELADWKVTLGHALGANAGIVAELVPEVEPIIGAKPAAAWLPADQARNRVYGCFRQLLRAFAACRRPLVLFLDDLQWLDVSSLGLLEHLLLDVELHGVLLIGALRDEKPTLTETLSTVLARLASAGRTVQTLPLAPLGTAEVERLVAEVLGNAPESSAELARVVGQKTGGNPFFVWQFLTALVEEQLLRFDQPSGDWRWDLQSVVEKGPTDNLTDLLVERLARLPEETQRALELLACLGKATPSDVLAALAGVSVDDLERQFSPAVLAEVVAQTRDGYAFRHDRLLTAAYSRIPETERPLRHYELGCALRARDAALDGDHLFAVVRHLNRALPLLRDERERIELARLNLRFAQRSRASAASANALAYLEQASALLPEDHWEQSPKLSFELALARAEAAFLNGERALAEALASDLAQRTLDTEAFGAVVCLLLPIYLTSNRGAEAVELGQTYLRRVGVPCGGIDDASLRKEYERLRSALGARRVPSLLNAPAMSSSSVQATMEVCSSLVSPAYFISQPLFAQLTMHMATLSLEHGHCDASAFAYSLLCLVLGPFFDEDELGLQFGELGARLAEFGSNRFAARAWLPMGALVAPRTVDAHAGHAWLVRACEACDQFGDVLYGIYTRAYVVTSLLASGAPLAEAERQADIGIKHASHYQFDLISTRITVLKAFIRGLRDPGHEPGSLSAEQQDEVAYEQALGDSPDRYYYWVRRAQARYYVGDYEDARASARKARALRWTSPFFPEEIELWLFGALSEAAASSNEQARTEALEIMSGDEQQLARWAARCPATFANKAALVSGELARLAGRDADAECLFEQAAELSRRHGLVHEEALAHELAARLYAARGIHSVAHAKLAAARACYVQWGALGKLSYLTLRGTSSEGTALLPLADSLEQLDVKVLVSVLRSVSSSLEPGKLIDALMTGALQQTAAERGVLVLVSKEPRIRARASSQARAIVLTADDVPMSPDALPVSILTYVLRTCAQIATQDGEVPAPFRGDVYFTRRPVRSLLCLPIVVRTQAVGALYLESTLTRQAFRARHVAALELLASQAAVSLENATLYATLQEAQRRVARAEHVSRTGSFSWRPQTQEADWSEEISNIFGIEGRPDLQRLRERIHPADRALFDSVLSDSSHYDGESIELRLLFPDASIKHVVLVASRLDTGEYVGTLRDVTESKQAEEALQRTQAALTDMTRVASLGEMAAAIAHEVNQPLAAIGLNASTCLRWLDDERLDPAEAREAALRIRRDATRAGAVVQRLRALFSKTDGVKVPVDINDAVSEVVALARSRIRAAGATVQLELQPGLPRALGDRVQLQQVVMNLLMNALEATRGLASPGSLRIRTLVEGRGSLCCEVHDNGRGVPERDRSRIFEPFFTTKYEGMGIGLSICRNILFSHGGELSLRPNRGSGAVFFFVLPIEAGSG